MMDTSDKNYDYYGIFRRHKKHRVWEEWNYKLQSWQTVRAEAFDLLDEVSCSEDD